MNNKLERIMNGITKHDAEDRFQTAFLVTAFNAFFVVPVFMENHFAGTGMIINATLFALECFRQGSNANKR